MLNIVEKVDDAVSIRNVLISEFWGKVRRNSNRFPTTRDSRRCKAAWLKPLISKFTPDF